MSIDLDAIEARLDAVPYRDMRVAVAPAAGSTETAAEYMAGALQSDGPIWVVWSPANDDSAPYLVNAITGDGPTSEAMADLIAHAPTDLAALLTELRATTGDLAVAVEVARERGEEVERLRQRVAQALRVIDDLQDERALLRVVAKAALESREAERGTHYAGYDLSQTIAALDRAREAERNLDAALDALLRERAR